MVVIELAQKYTKALVGGFIAGFILSLLFWKLYPVMVKPYFVQIERVGIVGEFSPNSLPQSIQKELSMGLTTIAPDGSVLPGLADTWVATDSGKIFTFYLRNDVAWHSGEAVTAVDVNYSIKSVNISVLDSKTLRITLPTAYSPLPSLLSKPLFKSGLQGMGVYKVASIKLNGDKVTYLKIVPANLKSQLRDKEYRFYRTEAAAILAYKMGDVDQLFDMSSPYDLNGWGETKVIKKTSYNRIVSIYFNMSNPQFQDKDFRHALALAVPKMPGERAISPISKTSWAYTDKLKKYDTDLVLAKKTLGNTKDATESSSLTLTTFATYADTAQVIADSWTSIGVPTSVKVVNTVTPEYEMLLSGQDIPPDPDQYPFWHSTQAQTNITRFGNVKIDKLLEDGRQVIDAESRKKIYADFQRRIVEEAPVIFLYYPTVYSITRAR